MEVSSLFIGLIGTAIGIYGLKGEDQKTIVAWIAVAGCSILSLFTVVYVRRRINQELTEAREIRTRIISENVAFHETCRNLHSISHLLRDALDALVDQRRPIESDTLLQLEKGTLSQACTVMAKTMTRLLGCDAHICVSLCRKRDDNTVVCFPWGYDRFDYQLSEGSNSWTVDRANTRFSIAAKVNEDDGLSYFLCNDLKKMKDEGRYEDQNLRFLEQYKACLVLPIRVSQNADREQSNESIRVRDRQHTLLGFVKLELKVCDKINNTYHRELLASFTDQVAAFLSAERLIAATPSVRINQQEKAMSE